MTNFLFVAAGQSNMVGSAMRAAVPFGPVVPEEATKELIFEAMNDTTIDAAGAAALKGQYLAQELKTNKMLQSYVSRVKTFKNTENKFVDVQYNKQQLWATFNLNRDWNDAASMFTEAPAARSASLSPALVFAVYFLHRRTKLGFNDDKVFLVQSAVGAIGFTINRGASWSTIPRVISLATPMVANFQAAYRKLAGRNTPVTVGGLVWLGGESDIHDMPKFNSTIIPFLVAFRNLTVDGKQPAANSHAFLMPVVSNEPHQINATLAFCAAHNHWIHYVSNASFINANWAGYKVALSAFNPRGGEQDGMNDPLHYSAFGLRCIGREMGKIAGWVVN